MNQIYQNGFFAALASLNENGKPVECLQSEPDESQRDPILTHICQDYGKYFDGLDYDHAQCGRCGNAISY